MKKVIIIKSVIVAVAAIIIVILLWRFTSSSEISMAKEGKLEITPTQIEKVRSIGEWEFLSVSDEEIADTIRHGFFGDDELARIYYGTLRLGIDLGDAGDDWITMDKDTVVVELPPVKLLDDNFIDEAKTKSFIEDGKWSEADRAAMTRKAETMMRKRCMTKTNMAKAEDNAKKQMTKVIQSMGFQYVRFRDNN